jgi:hypothetical protein
MSSGTPHGAFLADLPNFVPYLIDLVSAFILLAQIALQTKVIFFIHWLMGRGSHDDVTAPGIEQTAVFLMVMNFAQWMGDTFVEKKYVGLRHSECLFFGPRIWDAIIQTLFPFLLYFRFHSSMAFAEFLLWKRRSIRKMASLSQGRPIENNRPIITSFV